jgi:NAD(P)H dehydrogenase (quinone)
MSKVLVLYYSSYGHIEAMAAAIAEGPGKRVVDIKRVPELVPDEVARNAHYKVDQATPIAKLDDLAAYDAIIIGVGTPVRTSVIANGQFPGSGWWVLGARRLARKGRRAFTSTATQHGGQERTLFSIITNHFGMMVVGLDYGHAGRMSLDELTGGSPYGATTIAGGAGSRMPAANEPVGARCQGRKIAEIASKLHG